ncbi:MAG TPA: hypothetical protein VGL46_09545 [Pseudonocardiaceae bacterium]|jgi:uncharacterized membrane protein YczE
MTSQINKARHRAHLGRPQLALRRIPWIRLSALATGTVAMGCGVALLLRARLGLLPLDVLHVGAAHVLGSTVGGGMIAVQAVALLTYLPLRIRPGIGTIAAFVVPAIVVDLLMPALPLFSGLAMRIAVFTAGGLVFCLGVAIYLAADLGRIPRDAMMGAFAGKLRKQPVPPLRIAGIRIAIDILCVVAGALLLGPVAALRSGMLGFGSLALVCGCGPLVAFLWHGLTRLTVFAGPQHALLTTSADAQ